MNILKCALIFSMLAIPTVSIGQDTLATNNSSNASSSNQKEIESQNLSIAYLGSHRRIERRHYRHGRRYHRRHYRHERRYDRRDYRYERRYYRHGDISAEKLA